MDGARPMTYLADMLQYGIMPVELIHHQGHDIHVPAPGVDVGSYALLLKERMLDIVYGRSDPFGWTKVISEPKDHE